MSSPGKNKRNKLRQKGKGSSQLGVCSCTKCNYSVAHKRGVPCTSLICPNCNIPLIRQTHSIDSNKQQGTNKNTINSSFPIVNTETCIGCGACVDICPSEAIHLENNKAKITTTNCKNCKACVNACPVGAIS